MRKKKLPNIVLIVLDTHRRDRLSTYGYGRRTSPNIDAFAQTATVFENAISAAQWTIPSHTSMFTGEYPTTHQTLQPHSMLDSRFETVATLLAAAGYQTTGFCNNPLLGVLNNGLKRGFHKFYNYCGMVPSVPRHSIRLPWPFNNVWEWYTQQLRKASYPFQNAFANSDFLFQLSLHPKFVSFWSKLGNFKGHTANSIRDTTDLLKATQSDPSPQFVFLNLMETHLPFRPPDTFIEKFAPYFRENRAARDFIRRYNVETFRWLAPFEDSPPQLELDVLNDLYDAEVNYQDHLLGQLLESLSQAEDTLTLIVADHGEGIGEHHFMGHSFVAYQELAHVPLLLKFPETQGSEQRLADMVSTRRLFHTILEAARIEVVETNYRPATDVKALSLKQSLSGQDPEEGLVFVEAYPPTTILSIMTKHAPHLLDQFHCRLNRWAVYQGNHKLVKIEGVQDELFNLTADPAETRNIIDQSPETAAHLSGKLKAFIPEAVARRPHNWQANQSIDLENDENIIKQLQALGYIE